jgi:acyl-CoA synthetase (AMP-forming)/AMP-acid ligase II
VAVTDASGKRLPAGEAGEIRVRGYTVTRGYWNDGAATAAAIDCDGWLHTGDIGVLDEAGRLSVVDREKDMFIAGGFNAYPAEIERLLAGCPGVAQAAVIGVSDERLGEVGCAYVIPVADGTPTTAASVTAWARKNMANFKVPRHIRLVTELPRNASGKVLKAELRERFAKEAGSE